MQERIIEILVYVLSELKRTQKPVGEIDLSLLVQKGYTQQEISTAFAWLNNRLQSEEKTVERSTKQEERGSFRVLHRAEQYVITPEAYGYLIQLRELNILSQQEMELIIEQAMLEGFELSIHEIQNIVTSVLFETGWGHSSNNRTMLNSNDTIN